MLFRSEYFGPVLFSIYDATCGFVSLLAFLFVVQWLYRSNEWTALLAAGVSKARVIRPLFYVSLIALGLSIFSRELIIPQWSHVLSKNPQDLQGTERILPIRPTEDPEYGFLIAGKSLATQAKAIQNPVFVLFGPASTVVPQIQGEKGTYLEATPDHPAGYLVSGLGSPKFLTSPSVQLDGKEFLCLPSDNPWLAVDQCFLPSSIEFDMLRGGGAKQFASTSDLFWQARNQGQFYGEDLKLLINTRFLQPLLDMTLILLGLPIVLSRRYRNVIQRGIACLFAFGIFAGSRFALSALCGSSSLVSPSMAVWVPLLLFAPYGYARTRQALME